MYQPRVFEVGEAALPSQRIQHQRGNGELLAQRQPIVDRFLCASEPKKYQMDRLYAEHHGDKDRGRDYPKIAQGRLSDRGALGSKCDGGTSMPKAFNSFKKLGRMPVARKLPCIFPASSVNSFTK